MLRQKCVVAHCLLCFAQAVSVEAVTTSTFCSESGSPPGRELNLTGWKVQLPEKCGSGTICEKSGDELDTYADSFFYSSKVAPMVFCTPLNGVHTPNTRYPRAELEGLTSWDVDDKMNHKLSASLQVLKLANVSDPSTVIGQIHGDSSKPFAQLLKLRWKQKHHWIEARVKDKDDNEIDAGGAPILTDVQLEDNISYTVEMTGTELEVIVNGHSVKYSYDFLTPGANKYYFKAGNYCQNAGDTNQDGCMVAFSTLSAHHKKGKVEIVADSVGEGKRGNRVNLEVVAV